MSEVIRPQPLRDQLRDIILDRIVSGELEPGANINENDIAEQLEVSRTPVREALLKLQAEKLVNSRAGRGFYVSPLVADEAEELYEAIGVLESAALEIAGGPAKQVFPQLRELNRKREGARDDARENLELDLEWHRLLLSSLENSLIKELIEQLKIRFLRYELTYMHSPERIEVALEDHRRIIDYLKNDRIEDAAVVLRRHWTRASELLLAEIRPTGEPAAAKTGSDSA